MTLQYGNAGFGQRSGELFYGPRFARFGRFSRRDRLYIPPGLVGKWLFAGNASAYKGTVPDLSGNGYHGTIYGAPALSFDGTADKAYREDNIRVDPPLSFECWLTEGGVGNPIWTDTNGEYGYELYEFGTFALAFVTNGGAWQTAANVLTSGGRHHIRVHWDGVEPVIYVDGVLRAVTTEGDEPAYVGAGSTCGFSLDDSAVMTVHQACVYAGVTPLHDLYSNPQPATVTGYDAFWRFKDGSSNATDSSGNSKTLAVSGATWVFGANLGDGWSGGATQFSAGGGWTTDGVNDYAITDGTFTLGTSPFRVHLWVTGGTSTVLMSQGNFGEANQWSMFSTSGGVVWVYGEIGNVLQVKSTSDIRTGIHLVTLARVGNDFALYIDGVPEGSGDTNASNFAAHALEFSVRDLDGTPVYSSVKFYQAMLATGSVSFAQVAAEAAALYAQGPYR